MEESKLIRNFAASFDSTLKKLPDGRLAQRLSPRRKGSHWTELNKERCRDLERRGLMIGSGRVALK